MRIVILGAGAVGVVMGVALEHMKHEVIYLVRPGRRRQLQQLLLIHAATGETRCRERPQVAELGDDLPPFEWFLIATRGDQLQGAMEALHAHGKPGAALGVAAVSTIDLAEVRASWPNAPVFTVTPAFCAWSEEPGSWRWFQPPLVKTITSGEGDPESDKAAAEFAGALLAAGIPARAVPSAKRMLASLLAPGSALLAGWELAGWDALALARDGSLRKLTAQAIGEAARAVRDDDADLSLRLLTLVPAAALDLLLRALPVAATANLREMWKHHGPKIRGQTREILDRAIERSRSDELPRLRELRARLLPLE